MMSKQELRAGMRAWRRALSIEEQLCASQAVWERLQSLTPYKDAKCVMAYVACRGELSVQPAIEAALDSGKTLVLPRCGQLGAMTARRIEDLSQLVPGMFGLMEPGAACGIVPPQEIDLILVPGAAFDREGNRLGQGGGYYDRFLPQSKALRVGICHDRALLDGVPHDAHDIRMDAVITPGECIRLNDHRRNGYG